MIRPRGHQSTVQIIEHGERLGFDSAWLCHRHLPFEISSPIAMMAAASQRTSWTELGTFVTPLDWENQRGSAGRGRINPRLIGLNQFACATSRGTEAVKGDGSPVDQGRLTNRW